MSDNISVKYLFDQQNLITRQARWLSFLRKYDFEIKNKKWKENKVANVLSRPANLLYATSKYESDLEDTILNVEFFYKEYKKLKETTV